MYHASMPLSTAQTQQLKRIAADAMRARGLQADFPAEALREAQSLTAAVGLNAGVRDLRSLLWSSIDNDESRDLDQIEVAERVGNSATLRVAIADVDSLVKANSSIDQHAKANTTSVYTAAQIFPMLPERLSTDLTSLAQDQDRPAIVIEMLVQPDGKITAPQIYRALVRNRAKLAYHSIAAWLEGRAQAPQPLAQVSGLDEQLKLQDALAQSLRNERRARGALDLDTVEGRAVFAGGMLADLQPDPKNRAQELIEEFMIAANGVTARFLQMKGRSSLRRVLKKPERWERIVALAQERGERLPDTPDAVALQRFLTRRRQIDPERFGDLSLAVIKLLGSGEYTVERPGDPADGHFGLATRDYTHSTAPNRRFPDLITQRLLKAALLDIASPYGDEELESLAQHCTEQEGNAAKVERQVDKCAAAMLLESRIGSIFDAIVTGASDKGTWVRIRNPLVEGRVVEGFQGLDVGNQVRVKLTRIDVERGFIDFTAVK